MCLLLIISCLLAFSLGDENLKRNEENTTGVSDLIPCLASIELRGHKPYHMCGGVILNQRQILSSAQCLSRYVSSQIQVRVGSFDFERNGIVIPASGITKDDIPSGYDAVLINLASPITFNDKAKPIKKLPCNEPEAGAEAFVYGWGALMEDGDFPCHVQEKKVSIVGREECNATYNGGISYAMICAKAAGIDSQEGDGGGPLISNDNVLLGLVSWRYGKGYPGVYTNLATQEMREFTYSWSGLGCCDDLDEIFGGCLLDENTCVCKQPFGRN